MWYPDGLKQELIDELNALKNVTDAINELVENAIYQIVNLGNNNVPEDFAENCLESLRNVYATLKERSKHLNK